MEKTKPELGAGVLLALPFDEAMVRVKAALKAEGFGVLTEIDVRETMKQKLNVDFRQYVILGACNPPLAHQALSADLEVGLLLPCNVIVYDAGAGNTAVHIANPEAMSLMLDDPAFVPIAALAKEKLGRVAAALGK
jgi:uncharacterized protein (DUF302 family)